MLVQEERRERRRKKYSVELYSMKEYSVGKYR